MAVEPEQDQPAGAQGASWQQEGPAEVSRQPQTERAARRRSPMRRNRSRAVVSTAPRYLLRITTDEGETFEFSVPQKVALAFAWEILALSPTPVQSEEVAGG
jgi:hypothetical protein